MPGWELFLSADDEDVAPSELTEELAAFSALLAEESVFMATPPASERGRPVESLFFPAVQLPG